MPIPFDPLAQRYPSQRFPLYARGGMVNCSTPQAAAAGLEALAENRAQYVSFCLTGEDLEEEDEQ